MKQTGLAAKNGNDVPEPICNIHENPGPLVMTEMPTRLRRITFRDLDSDNITISLTPAVNRNPASPEARALVRKLQDFISEHYYTCTDQILSGLGQMYAAGSEMTRNIDNYGGEGTAAFAGQAIGTYCDRQ